jgi:CTP synthase
VGDIEAQPYVETVRQIIWEQGHDNAIVCHLTLIPYLKAAKELKTKPTQHSVKELQMYGLQPDVLVCRTEHEISDDIRNKLALFCNVDKDSVIQALDIDTIYAVPIEMQKENLDKIVLRKLKLENQEPCNLDKWNVFLDRLKKPSHKVTIGLVGKYIELQDAYKSIYESFVHAGAMNDTVVEVVNIHSEDIQASNVAEMLAGLDGVLVAPGFGSRGVEGKIEAIKYVRENNIPFFGICLGMQMAVIEYGRNVLGLSNAHSIEMDEKTPHPVIDMMEEQKKITEKGGTMRLGAYACQLAPTSRAAEIYGGTQISERHRHRYEFNSHYQKQYEEAGMQCTGVNPESGLVEIVEIPTHPFFVGVQFHPELKSTVENPHPVFASFIAAAMDYCKISHQQLLAAEN